MRIFLIRHAATKQSVNRFIKDDHRDFSLSKEGVRQASKLKKFFNKKENNFLIYTSPAKRCIQTAKIIFPKQKNEFKITPEFREINKGFLKVIALDYSTAAMTTDEWEAQYNNSKSYKKRYLYKYPSGESISQMSKRVTIFFDKIISINNKQDLVIISHNGPIKALITDFIGDKNLYRSIVVDHGCYSELIYNNKTFILNKLNIS